MFLVLFGNRARSTSRTLVRLPLSNPLYSMQEYFDLSNHVVLPSRLFYAYRRNILPRFLSDEAGNKPSLLVEAKIQNILKKSFPSAEYIEVQDVSGGCGAMFEISVIAKEFEGLPIVKQHRLVNEALKEEIKDMHGLRIHTSLPSK